jgi:hypothetical protein
VDKQACLISVHNLFSQIYIWASLISVEFVSPPDRPEYPDIFPDSPDFPEYPEKYPETPDLNLTAAKRLWFFRFDYSPPL